MLNRFVFAVSATVIFLLLSWTSAAAQQKQHNGASQARYAGSETCQACHDELHASLQKTMHEQLQRNARADENGCEACHGPGQDHVDNNGDRSKIVTFSDLPSKAVRERCRHCHQVSADKPHVSKGVGCLDCHSVHHAQQTKALLVLASDRLCQKCHTN